MSKLILPTEAEMRQYAPPVKEVKRTDRASATDKQVRIWALLYDVNHATEMKTKRLLTAARERGMQVDALTEDVLNQLLHLCGWRLHTLKVSFIDHSET